MGDQGAHHGGIQAQQPQVVEEPNQAAIYPAQPVAQAPVAQALVAAAVLQPMVQHIPIPSYQVPPPEAFNFKPKEWSCWIKRFERFRKATELDHEDGESQVNTLICSIGEEADDIVISFGLTAEEAK